MKYKFALDLLRILCRDEKKNFVISPYSLGIGLTALLPGLDGDTRTELLSALNAQNDRDLHIMFHKLYAHIESPLRTANKILTHKDCIIHEDYKKILEVSKGFY